MKKILFFVLTALTFAACEQALVEEQSAICPDVPETITVGFEGEDTRIQLNDVQKTVWTSGDLVSVFYRSDANQKWQYTGETGARTAELKQVDAGTASRDMDRVVIVYPYNEGYYINPSTYNVQASLPAVQNYLKDSYGLDGNIMISSSEYNNFSLKSVCGWLKLQLTGNGEKIKSITLKGNNGEQVAGELYINSADATAILSSDAGSADDGETGGAGGGLVFENTILKEVTLDCGEGVELGIEATAFYIALPPQTYTEGITVDITTINGLVMTKSTDKEVVIERNHIQPMTAFAADLPVPETWKIYYTSTAKVEPYDKTVFGATYVSNEWDSETGKGVITFDGDITMIGDYAFNNCTSLTSVYIPDSVTMIGDYAFFNCTSLTSINIPDSVTTIGREAFAFCGLTSVTIPDSVTSIGQGVFAHCSNLSSVTIPASVTTIGDGAFSTCNRLRSVYCNATTPPILGGAQVFDVNNSSRKIYAPYKSVNAYRSATNWSEYRSAIVGYDFENGKIVEVKPNYEIWYTSYGANKVTPFNTDAFGANIISNEYNNGKYVITFDGDVTSIGTEAFRWCSNLKSIIHIPDSVTSIGSSAFYECDRLESVIIPDSVTEIGQSAFYRCSDLKSVTIGSGVTKIKEYAFYECYYLSSVYCKATTPPVLDGYSVFDDNANSRKIYVPVGSVGAYMIAPRYSEYASAIVGYDFNQ